MSDSDNSTPSTIKFHYVKSNYFRVIHGDGLFGGFTPSGDIFFSVYSERAPLPDVTVQAIEHGNLGKEIIAQRVSSDGIVRELEVGVSMNAKVARSLIVWLEERVKIAEQFQEQQAQQVSEVKK
jgi:hypothetical protein